MQATAHSAPIYVSPLSSPPRSCHCLTITSAFSSTTARLHSIFTHVPEPDPPTLSRHSVPKWTDTVAGPFHAAPILTSCIAMSAVRQSRNLLTARQYLSLSFILPSSINHLKTYLWWSLYNYLVFIRMPSENHRSHFGLCRCVRVTSFER